MIISVHSMKLERHLAIVENELNEALCIQALLKKIMREQQILPNLNYDVIKRQLESIEETISIINSRISLINNTVQEFDYLDKSVNNNIVDAIYALKKF